jgi:dinuclear metal center YbgI/SA1388 family protein
MAIALTQIHQSLDELLQPSRFRDYCPNGLQVEGAETVTRLVSGVTACQGLLDAAVERSAQAILVHHGYFWRDENPTLTGMKRQRIATLLEHNISLFAYHLPLDAHPEYGNNACLARLLGVEAESTLDPSDPSAVGNIGSLEQPTRVVDIKQRLEQSLGRTSLHIGDPDARVQRLAWCTGAAQSYIDRAADAGAQLFISGEISEQTVHVARERGIHYIAAGHHATERYGVQALAAVIADRFGIEQQFVDIPNPV